MTQQPDTSLVDRITARILDAEIEEIRDLGAMDVGEYVQNLGMGQAPSDELIEAVRSRLREIPITYPRPTSQAAVGGVSPTEPEELGDWLRALPNGTILEGPGADTGRIWRVAGAHGFVYGDQPGLVDVLSHAALDISPRRRELAVLAEHNTPLTIRRLGNPVKVGDHSPTDPDELGQWLREVPGASVRDRDGHPAQIVTGVETSEGTVIRSFPALASSYHFGYRDLTPGSNDLLGLAEHLAPFTLLAFGIPGTNEWSEAR